MSLSEARGNVSKEVIDTLISAAKNVIGDNGVSGVLRFVAQKKSNDWTGVDVVFALADEIQNLFGAKGGYAVIRQIGREVAKSLMASRPKEEWEYLLEWSLNTFGFAERVEKGQGYAEICNCVFYEDVLKQRNLKPIEHAVCWGGWGFIEAFVKELYGAKGIKWIDRDYEEKKCKFEFLY